MSFYEPNIPLEPLEEKTTEFTPPNATKSYIIQSTVTRDEEDSAFDVSVSVKLKEDKTGIEEPGAKKAKLAYSCKRKDEEIGYLCGTLLDRPDGCFHSLADSIDGECAELAKQFCNRNGIADRIDNDKLTPLARHRGGFFHIYKVEIQRSHQGHDLGLQIMHEALCMLGDMWTLAVMKTAALEQMCSWEENKRLPREIDESVRLKHISKVCEKLKRYWSRMGFVQSGQTSSLHDTYFLCRDSYFLAGTSQPIPWKTKAEAAALVVYAPEAPVEISESDQRLKNLVNDFVGFTSEESTRPSLESVVSEIRKLVSEGASIGNSSILHIVSANGEAELLQAILALLGSDTDDVNAKDGEGNTALHVAASLEQTLAVRYLVEFGADKLVRNGQGDTPLQAMKKKHQNSLDFLGTIIPARLMVQAGSLYAASARAGTGQIETLLR